MPAEEKPKGIICPACNNIMTYDDLHWKWNCSTCKYEEGPLTFLGRLFKSPISSKPETLTQRVNDIDDELNDIFGRLDRLEAKNTIIDKPNLGIATTRELLEELRARGHMETEFVGLGYGIEQTMSRWIESLPEEMLNYKTFK